LNKAHRYLLDVNVLVALAAKSHMHHQTAREWFNRVPDIRWAVCAFTEAGFLRTVTAPRPGQIAMSDATATLKELTKHPGYRYLPITADWHSLCRPLFSRLYGTKQVTDAYLLGLCIHEGLVLATFDKGILHLAGEYKDHVLMLSDSRNRLQ
jgi:toxin-antitoxin system PIN domain toxin